MASMETSEASEKLIDGLSQWREYADQTIPQILQEVKRLQTTVDPETTPFKSKYEAIELLTTTKNALETYVSGGNADRCSEEEKEEAKDLIATIQYKQGSLALQTEDLSQAEGLLTSAVDRLQLHEQENARVLQDTLNQLGVIWSSRSEYLRAEEFLKRAERIYEKYSTASVSGVNHDVERRGAEDAYTMTTFYLAQVYGFLQDDGQSATYCAKTLRRQLEHGDAFDPLDWAQNAVQLSSFYLGKGDLNSALRCVAAAESVAAKEDSPSGDRGTQHSEVLANIALAKAKVHMCCLERSSEKARVAEEITSGASEELPAVQQPPASVTPEDTPSTSGGASDPAVCAELGPAGSSPSVAGPEFPTLGLPEPSLGEECGPDGRIKDYTGAVAQFNKSFTMFKKGLEYFVLDGFVTDHFDILMDISRLYKHLAAFEKDPHRASLIHRRRATKLAPLVDLVNPAAYETMWKSLNLELARIAIDVVELEEAAQTSHAKIAKAAAEAAEHYSRFVEAFSEQTSSGRMTAEDWEAVARGYFGLARACYKVAPPKVTTKQQVAEAQEPLVRAQRHYRTVIDLVEKHNISSMKEEVQLCKEMEELLEAKVNLEMKLTARASS